MNDMEQQATPYPPKISVIIPIHNGEEYIENCIDSILDQTIQCHEIICIDDGSTDSTAQILKNLSDKHKILKIITQKQSFAGIARNVGIENSSGEYLTFIDCDDVFERNALEIMMNLSLEHDADVVRASARTMDDKKEIINWSLNRDYVRDGEIFNWHERPKDVFCISSGNPWGMLVKKDLVMKNNIRFLDTANTEDIGFTYLAYLHANKIVTTYETVILHRFSKQGLECMKIKFPEAPYEARCKLLNIIKERGFYEETAYGFWIAAIRSYYLMLKDLTDRTWDYKSIRTYYDAIQESATIQHDFYKDILQHPPDLLKDVCDGIEYVLKSKNVYAYIIMKKIHNGVCKMYSLIP